jgi:hypothetical protein
MHCAVMDRFYRLMERARFFRQPENPSDVEGHAIDEAIADYFAASFANESMVDDRDLAGTKRRWYPTESPAVLGDAYSASQILSSAFWDLRSFLGPSIANPLVAGAIDFIIRSKSQDTNALFAMTEFRAALHAADANNEHSIWIDEAMSLHNLGPHPNAFQLLAFSGDGGLRNVEAMPSEVSIRAGPKTC